LPLFPSCASPAWPPPFLDDPSRIPYSWLLLCTPFHSNQSHRK
jgi:hypothetical protein